MKFIVSTACRWETGLRILLADDHPLFREGVKPVLHKLHTGAEVLEAVDYPSAFEMIHRHGEVDLALLDLYMPGMAAVDGVRRFRAAFPSIPVVVLSASEQTEDIHNLLASGALGYITKSLSSEKILDALRLILAGQIFVPPGLIESASPRQEPPRNLSRYPALTVRQIDVLRQLSMGLSNRQIGDNLDITEGTVKIHLAAIFRILKVANRTEAVLIAQKMGLHRTA